MTEVLRGRLQRVFRRVLSAYGASDLDIGVAGETELAVALRQAAAADPDLAQALFGRTGRLPMVFQYDPSTYHVETVDGELVMTVTRPLLSPRVRYAVHDAGGVLDVPRTRVAIAQAYGVALPTGRRRPAAAAVRGRPGRLHAVPHGRQPLPGGRGRRARRAGRAAPRTRPGRVLPGAGRRPRTAAARPGSTSRPPTTERPLRPDPAPVSPAGWSAHNRDWAAAAAEDPRALAFHIRPTAPGTGVFQANAHRIKRRYVLQAMKGTIMPAPLPLTGEPLAAPLPPAHRRVLTAALRAPSAHNAQPWRIRVRDDAYELHYDHHDYLPADPDDRDAYLCMGAFCETLALAALRARAWSPTSGRCWTGPAPTCTSPTSTLGRADGVVDPLAAALAGRATNRSRYTGEPLPAELADALSELGCVLVPTEQVARIVRRASVLSWRDRRFVSRPATPGSAAIRPARTA